MYAIGRFVAKVDFADGCWEWKGFRNASGYGKFRDDGFSHQAHRWMLRAVGRPAPAFMETDHLCRNRGCVNPFHLDIVTRKENVLRGESPAAKHARKTHCPRGHEYNETNTHRNAKNERRCRQCWRRKGGDFVR